MAKPIYVGGTLGLTNNQQVLAIRPAGKGDTGSFCLTAEGKLVELKGQRIAGVGVERFITERGFTAAEDGNEPAARLTDLIAVREGTTLVEKASSTKARELQILLGGKICTFVPFNADMPTEPMLVRDATGFSCTSLNIGTGFASGTVEGEYQPEQSFNFTSADLSKGWLVGPEGDPAAMPRNSEYGGPVELAMFVMANCGIGTLAPGAKLEMDPDTAADSPFPRGSMVLTLPDENDKLVAGINAIDELVVQYLRNGQVIASREGLESMNGRLTLGSTIGSIAAILVLVANSSQPKGTRRKKAA